MDTQKVTFVVNPDEIDEAEFVDAEAEAVQPEAEGEQAEVSIYDVLSYMERDAIRDAIRKCLKASIGKGAFQTMCRDYWDIETRYIKEDAQAEIVAKAQAEVSRIEGELEPLKANPNVWRDPALFQQVSGLMTSLAKAKANLQAAREGKSVKAGTPGASNFKSSPLVNVKPEDWTAGLVWQVMGGVACVHDGKLMTVYEKLEGKDQYDLVGSADFVASESWSARSSKVQAIRGKGTKVGPKGEFAPNFDKSLLVKIED